MKKHLLNLVVPYVYDTLCSKGLKSLLFLFLLSILTANRAITNNLESIFPPNCFSGTAASFFKLPYHCTMNTIDKLF